MSSEIEIMTGGTVRAAMNDLFEKNPDAYKEWFDKKFIPLKGKGGFEEVLEILGEMWIHEGHPTILINDKLMRFWEFVEEIKSQIEREGKDE